jgi:butyrate kinase
MSKNILVINPGATTSKLGLFDGTKCVHQEKVIHSDAELEAFPRLSDQREARLRPVREFLKGRGFQKGDLIAVVGRGGLLQPLASGTYSVNNRMLADLEKAARGEHASNLGAPMALDIANEFGCPAFIVDPVAVDEMNPVARFTGVKGVERQSLSHALNMKAVAKRHARSLGKPYEELNLIVAHMGSGTSLSAHSGGRMIDVVNPKDEGPMAGDRAGAVPSSALIDMCFLPGASAKAVKKVLFGDGGLYSHLGTRDIRDAIARMEKGDAEARAVVEAMAYQVAKYVGEMATVLNGKVDGILLTGGVVFNPPVPEWVRDRVAWIAPVTFYPGEDELQALAEGALRALAGEEPVKEYGV